MTTTRNKLGWASILKSKILLPAVAIFLLTGTAQAQFLLLDDFEGVAADSVIDLTSTDTVTWDGASTHLAVVDSGDADNQVLQILGENIGQRLRGNFIDPANNIAAGAVGTVFFRFRTSDAAGAGTLDSVFGLTPDPAIGNFNFKCGLRLTSADVISGGALANNFDVRDGGDYDKVGGLASLTWYKLWVVADNTSDTAGTFKVYLQSDDDPAFTTQTQLALSADEAEPGKDVFDFRVNGATDIVNVYFRTGNAGSTGSELYYDDVYINNSAEDLTDPLAEVDGVLLGDVNLDGQVTFLDISPFIALLSSGTLQAEADVNEDGAVSFLDISVFIGILSS